MRWLSDVLPHQLNDEELAPLNNELKEGQVHAPYFLSKGVLCCRERRGHGPKIVLPAKLVPMVFSYYHDSPVGGKGNIPNDRHYYKTLHLEGHGQRYCGPSEGLLSLSVESAQHKK